MRTSPCPSFNARARAPELPHAGHSFCDVIAVPRRFMLIRASPPPVGGVWQKSPQEGKSRNAAEPVTAAS